MADLQIQYPDFLNCINFGQLNAMLYMYIYIYLCVVVRKSQ